MFQLPSRENLRPVGGQLGRPRPQVAAAYLERPTREELRHIDKDAAAVTLDRLLVRLARHESLCRLRIGRLAARVLDSRAYHRLGFARLGDYTLERLGLSAREIQSTARVWRKVDALPLLGQAFACGRLNWTKLRTLSDIDDLTNVEHWISLAENMTSRQLDQHIKDLRQSPPAGSDPSSPTAADNDLTQTAIRPCDPDDGDDDDLIDGEPRAELRIRCPGHLRPLWREVSELASRSAGSVLAGWQTLEAVAAEAASGPALLHSDPSDLGNGERASRGENNAKGGPLGASFRVPSRGASLAHRQTPSGWDGELEVLRALVRDNVCLDVDEILAGAVAETGAPGDIDADHLDADQLDTEHVEVRRFAADHIDTDLLDADLLDADQLDEALRAVLDSMRSIDWQLGRLLATFMRLSLHRHVGYPSFATYVRDRLGLSSRKAGSLARIEGNPADGRGALAAAYRAGRISWVRALALLPVMSQRHGEAWIERAERVTVRRLRDEVQWALDMRDRAWLFMELIPPPLGRKLQHTDAEVDRQMRALYDADMVEQIKQRPRLDNSCLRFSGPVSVIELFHEVLRSYADAENTWEPAWKALERILVHVKAQWSAVPRHRNPIHERDGFRCRVPACSSRRNLQEHHVLYRSRGGGNARGNRISICAWHHLHGIHGGYVRAHGDADEGIHWQLGTKLVLVDEVYAG